MAKPDATRRLGETARVGWLFIGGMVLFGLLGILIVTASLTVMWGGWAYIHGEGRWSKGQQEAAFYLDQYAETGEDRYLGKAHRALEIPLGDREARLALQEPEYNYEKAYEGLLQGQNHPANIPVMIWLFRHFQNAPYMKDAIRIWEVADTYILLYASLADRLEAEWAAPSPDREEIKRLRERLIQIDDSVRALENRFSATLAEGLRHMGFGVGIVIIVAVILLSTVAIMLFLWATRRIAASEHKFWASFERAPVGVALVSADGHYTEVNEAFSRIHDRKPSELLGASIDQFTHPEDREPAPSLLARVQEVNGGNVTLEQRYLRADGYTLWGKLTLRSDPASEDDQRAFIALLEDVSEARELSEQLSYQASHDPLTGEYNRRQFDLELNRTLEEVHTGAARHMLGFLDIDQFKLVNDTCGHNAGDAFLCQVAHTIKNSMRSTDTLARLGGDEFGGILRDCDSETGCRAADKIRAAVAEHTFHWEERSFTASCSIGLVPLDETVANAETALQLADTACYLAKEQGRNRIQLHSDEKGGRTHEARGAMEWVTRIRDAIAAHRLELWRQRILPLDDSSGRHYEVLVRLRDVDGELHMPGVFLPPAERYQIATLIDRWVIEHLLEHLHAENGYLDVASSWHVNLSGQSLGDEHFIDWTSNTVRNAGLRRAKLCFEITETAAITRLDEARDFLERLRSWGCDIALDDFGRGLSSYAYLKSMPVDILKIDGSFVRNIVDDEFDRAIVSSIVQIARVTGMRTIAEFVENDAILEKIREVGVDFAQGYGVEHPRPLDEPVRPVRGEEVDRN